MGSFLSIRKLKKTFLSNYCIEIENLDIKKGEIFSILGPSGCGKTSLLRMLGGFELPDTGEIILNNENITKKSAHKRSINTVFQSYALFPHLTVWENIAFGLRIAKIDESQIHKSVDKMLNLIQLNNEAQKKPNQISGGQKQRVAIARALVMKPQVLLLDEPLSALDLKLRQRMLLQLDQIHDEVGITFIFVTHDQSEAMGISDRMAVMNNGKIEQIGTPAEIYEAPKNSFVASFIGDTNFFHGSVCKNISSDYMLINIEDLGVIKCYKDKQVKVSDHACISIRPEKFYISLDPSVTKDNHNIVQGIVEDIIYLGSQTKYWIRVKHHRIAVFRQHNHFLLDEQRITWEDKVWLTWSADDGYMIDKYEKDYDPNL